MDGDLESVRLLENAERIELSFRFKGERFDTLEIHLTAGMSMNMVANALAGSGAVMEERYPDEVLLSGMDGVSVTG